MSLHKLFHNALLIFTFLYLIMCPASEKIGKGLVDHNIINKIGSSLEDKIQSGEAGALLPCFTFYEPDAHAFSRSPVIKNFLSFFAADHASNLSRLATVRLLL